MPKSDYCTQNNGDCVTCSLTNYGLNCANEPINKRPRQNRKDAFEQFAISQGVHNGPHTLSDLHQLRKEHKGSKWITIVELFKARAQAVKTKGVEVIDGDCIWVDAVDNLIPFDVLRRLKKTEVWIETIVAFDGNLCDRNDYKCPGHPSSPMRGNDIAHHVPREQWSQWTRIQRDLTERWELID